MARVPRAAPFLAALLCMGSAHASESRTAAPQERPVLRVCADPNNLPFSNRAEAGLEKPLAQILARDPGWQAEYTRWPQRRGFIRQTLRAGACDVVGDDDVIDTRDDTVTAQIGVGARPRAIVFSTGAPQARPWGLSISPDGRRLYTANGPSNDVRVVDAMTLVVLVRMPVRTSPWGTLAH